MDTRSRWSKMLIIIGSVFMIVGILDPMEGSVIILLGSGLAALGSYLSTEPNRRFRDDLTIFLLNLVGVGFLWGFSFIGGIGEGTDYSMWWALTLLPYAIGLLLGLGRVIGRIVAYFKAKRAAPSEMPTSV